MLMTAAATDRTERRAELLGWIAETRRNQRRLAILLAGFAVIAIGIMLWRTSIGVLALVIAGMIGMIGFWITWSHIADWRARLDQLRTR